MDFSDLGKMKEMLGQAKQMQEQMERKLAETVVEASSGGGVVTVRMSVWSRLGSPPPVIAGSASLERMSFLSMTGASIGERKACRTTGKSQTRRAMTPTRRR